MNDILIDILSNYERETRMADRSKEEISEDIYDEKLKKGTSGYNSPPYYIYFYYVALNSSGAIQIRHYWQVDGDRDDEETWKPISFEDAKKITRQLAINARKDIANQDPKPDGYNFENIVWVRRSYMVMVFDEPYWSFFKKKSENSPIIFTTRIKGKNRGTKNHTFFDAEDFILALPPVSSSDTGERTGLIFVNHMKGDEFGNKLMSKQYFQFNMFFEVKLSDNSSAPLTVIFDPGGTNQGPPEVP